MKTLLTLLVLALALGGIYWKTQHPEAGMAELRTQAEGIGSRLKSGVDAVLDGGKAAKEQREQFNLQQEESQNRLNLIEKQLADSQQGDRTSLNELQSQIANLESRLETALDASAAEEANRAEFTRLQQGIDALTENNTSVQTGLNALTKNNTSVQTGLNALKDDNTAVQASLDAINGRMDLLSRRLDEDTVTEDIAAIDQRLDGLSADIEQIRSGTDASISKLQASITESNEKSAVLATRFDTLSSDLSSDTSETDSTSSNAIKAQIDQRLAQIESRLSTTNTDSTRLQALIGQQEDVDDQLSGVDARFDALDNRFAEFDITIASLQTSAESVSIDALQDEISQQLSSIQSQVESSSSSTDVESLTSSLETTRNRIETLEQRVQDLPASSNAADNAQQMQSALQSQIADLEERLSAALDKPDTDLVDSISQVKEQVSELASKSYVTREELRAEQSGEAIEYKIYFDRNSTAVTEDAARVLKSFIAQEQNRTTGVSIYGFTDRIGSSDYNQLLAQQRASNVRSYLIQNGFDYTKIRAVDGLGEDAAAAIQEDDREDAQQRSVVLYAAQP